MQRLEIPRPIDLSRRLLLSAAAALGLVLSTSLPARAETPPRVELVTSLGTIEVQLDPQRAPKTVANFLQYVKSGFYGGTIFHRVIPGFMIQGGGFTPDMQQKPTQPPIPLESQNGLKNLRGTIAMARTANPNSATSQFFINLVDNPALDYPQPDGHGYAVFGQVIKGMDVVDRIAKVPTQDAGPYQNVPVTPVVIKQAILLK
ncbi:MAG: peptidylprolyl isomerase [Betaproteobacteria bacterium]|jgi:peptidyl-prolyl cis-trans isomerase A (cyclophilin A)|uniref:Peptidyl-prolyl cis-trans isomerase n=1 Tax=Thiomonas delicata TaxID=364030 RepID=A0A238D4P4_THIDL|nr:MULTISPECIES: peptidylprolyl isomerase [Thiomonas]MDE2128687.1 peptidylprolyl isomerase [Betaproteobacteria bacterium]OZB61833.1 MAG: peptidylprolyl isomerase [Thiomonas sp. 13-66-29]SBP88288.1 peptidyl-prolyl cis-trans isomerase A (rotamase A) [Thiomonas delicata]